MTRRGEPDLSVVIARLFAAGAVSALVVGSAARGDRRPDSDVDVGAWSMKAASAGSTARSQRFVREVGVWVLDA